MQRLPCMHVLRAMHWSLYLLHKTIIVASPQYEGETLAKQHRMPGRRARAAQGAAAEVGRRPGGARQ